MTSHHHHHTHESQEEQHSHRKIDLSGLHRDWRTWLVIGLMLAAIGVYVLSLDEAVQPRGPAQGGLPAAAAPAGPSK
jgi:ABC-type nickel/cobalt efflux system permease component RcnA